VAEVQVKKLTIRHDAIMDYLLVNPTHQLGMVAGYFNVSQAWLSVIIHSDAFQSKLREKSDTLFGATVIPLREKIMGLAHVGVDKLGLALENASPVSDKQFIADTTDSILKNLGYSPKSAPSPEGGTTNVQNNFYSVDKEALAKARGSMQAPASPASESDTGIGTNNRTDETVLITGGDNAEDRKTAPAEGVQECGGTGDGGILTNPAPVCKADPT